MDDYSQFAHYGSLVITIGGVIWGSSRLATRNEASAKAAKAIALEAKEEAVTAFKEAMEAKERLAAFREYVALKYASIETLEKTEKAIIDAINRLGDRFDRYVDTGRPPEPTKGNPPPSRRS